MGIEALEVGDEAYEVNFEWNEVPRSAGVRRHFKGSVVEATGAVTT
jgi:hypothetical protein